MLLQMILHRIVPMFEATNDDCSPSKVYYTTSWLLCVFIDYYDTDLYYIYQKLYNKD